MSAHHLLTDGRVIDIGIDDRDRQLEELRAENRRLQRVAADAELRADRAQEDAQRALGMLRRQLSPLYKALQAVFGELDAAGVMDAAEGPPAQADSSPRPMSADPRVAAVWESWKNKLGGQCAKVIDVLLTHREMNTTQLAIAVGTRRQNIPNLIYKLNQAGLINKNGGRFSLKEL